MHGGDRVLRFREAEFFCGQVPIQFESRRAVPSGAAERVLVEPAASGIQSVNRILEGLRKTVTPEADRRRHRLLHMGVTRQLDVALPIGQPVERLQHAGNADLQFVNRGKQIEAQGCQHLIVP